jgi:flagellar capping protein FliD
MHADIDKMVSNKVCEEARKSNNEAIKGIRADLDKQHDVLVNVDKNMATLTERVTNFMDQFNR